MWLAILGIVIGVSLGSIVSFSIPVIYAKYLSVAILAAVDSLLGGIKGIMEDKFDSTLMLSGFFTNALVAAALALLGDKLGLDLYMVAVLAFGLRIFNNLGTIRRDLLDKYRKAKNQKSQEETPSNTKLSGLATMGEILAPTLQEEEKEKNPEPKATPTIHQALEETMLKSEAICKADSVLELDYMSQTEPEPQEDVSGEMPHESKEE